MKHLESVEQITDTVSRWQARRAWRGTIVEWNAEIINEVPNELIAWRSLEGSDVVSAGSVHFDEAGAGRGTARPRAAAVQPARRQGRRGRRQAARPGCGAPRSARICAGSSSCWRPAKSRPRQGSRRVER